MIIRAPRILAWTAALAAAASLVRADDPHAVARRLTGEPAAPVRTAASPAVAAALMAELEPVELEGRIAERPELIPGIYGTLADALAREREGALGGYLTAVSRARSRRLATVDWTGDDADLLLALQLVDPGRFADDPALRERVLALLPRALDARAPPALRDRVLHRLQQIRGVGFDAFEDVAWSWGALERPSDVRELAGAGGLALGDSEGPIRASIFSLPSALIGDQAAVRFLAAVRRAAPRREILVLRDRPLIDGLGVHRIETWGFPYSPWPRDPLTFLDDGRGRKVALLRPPSSRQGRPEDSWLGRTLVQGLPRHLDDAWRLHWRRASFPFHNGQILDVRGRLWISLHTLEPRILELVGLAQVPVESFAGAAGARYVEAARRAAAELGELYGREVAFVHPLPAPEDAGEARAVDLKRLGGGAGFDLDSLVTLLPTARGLTALVADPAVGGRLVAGLPSRELDGFATAYGLTERGENLRWRLQAAQSTLRAHGLGVFLEVMAKHLETVATVQRMPLLLVPRELQADRGAAADPDFLVSWNNVVIERNGGPRAEGFSSQLATGDAWARRVFSEHGYRLELFPPLVASVVGNGGYRCASQHVR